jgi:hypothetical protein
MDCIRAAPISTRGCTQRRTDHPEELTDAVRELVTDAPWCCLKPQPHRTDSNRPSVEQAWHLLQ